MTPRMLAAACKEHLGERCVVAGWVHRVHNLGKIQFVLLRDRSGMVQIVYETEQQTAVQSFEPESILRVSGLIVSNEQSPGGFEIHAENTELLASPHEKMPLSAAASPLDYGIEATLDHRLSSLRNPAIRGIFELESVLIAAFSAFLRSQGFTEIKTSKLIGTGTEGGTELFLVHYFDKQVYLAQSPQFYKQAMVASGLEQVFEVAPAYRAEKHDTSRHLNEYISLDVELGFIDDEHDLMDLECRLLAYIMEQVVEQCAYVFDMWERELPNPSAFLQIPRCSYAEAKAIVKERTKRPVFDINPEAERVLCEWAQQEHGIDALFVYDFPKRKRPFYTYPKGRASRSFDLLFKGVEITTGGQRIHDYTMLTAALAERDLSKEELGDYTSIFAYGCPPHGGFAIGLERLAQQLLGLKNIKEASLFPRDRNRIRP